MRDLTRGPILGHIVAMAVPIAVGMLVQTLYYLVDLYFVSRLGEVALAGASAGGNVMFLMMAFTQTLAVGTLSTVSHAVGAGDKPRANWIFNQALFLASSLAVATLAAGYLGPGDLYISAIAADAPTAAAGAAYIRWVIPAMAFAYLTSAMGAALQGTGIVKPTMFVQLTTVFINIVLTPVLVAGWLTERPMGVAGAALATTISAATGTGLMAFYFWKLERYVRFDAAKIRPRWTVLRRMLSIGLPAGGEFALMFVYLGAIYAAIATFGPAAQAGYGIGMRLMQAIFLPVLAISFAAPAVAGQNFGAKKADRVRETFRKTALLSSVLMVVMTVFCRWRPQFLVAPFSRDSDVVEVASMFLTILSLNYVASGLIFTCSGIFQGIGNTLPALAATGTRMVTFLVPLIWISKREGFAIEHVWYLSVATVTLQTILSLLLLRRELNRRLPALSFAPEETQKE